MIEWPATILSIIGFWLVTRHNVWGYYIWIVANALWIWFALSHQMYGMLTLVLFYECISWYGAYSWRKTG